MPFDKVMHKFKHGKLHSGKHGPEVKDKKQAIAIMMSEKSKKKPEYKSNSKKVDTGPSKGFMAKFGKMK